MKGILFKPDMIQAVVEGRKTQTRRVINPQPTRINEDFDGTWEWKGHYYDDLTLWSALKDSSPYKVGETVYIKEAWKHLPHEKIENPDAPNPKIWYRSDFNTTHNFAYPWKSPLFMPEWAARHFITILAVRAERLQEINPGEWEREGLELVGYEQTKQNFINLWNPINRKYPWESNPWVFPYEFELVRGAR